MYIKSVGNDHPKRRYTNGINDRRVKDEKDRYRKQLNELLEFDKKLNSLSNQMIELDLDDGVKVNYENFGR